MTTESRQMMLAFCGNSVVFGNMPQVTRTLWRFTQLSCLETAKREDVVQLQLFWPSNRLEQRKCCSDKRSNRIVYPRDENKKGFSFYSKTWELVGFTDLSADNVPDDATGTGTKKRTWMDQLATHVLQLFFASMPFKFVFPCAFFFTQDKIAALKINRLFWLGVSMLHIHGFKVILSCCDGASPNRSFIEMNTCRTKKRMFQSIFWIPIFFFSDPPHLIKNNHHHFLTSHFFLFR